MTGSTKGRLPIRNGAVKTPMSDATPTAAPA